MEDWPWDPGLDVVALVGAALGTLVFALKERYARRRRLLRLPGGESERGK